ncbi:uncharacterized protein LOC128392119 [Panonychus citri]|uniref:uncharacterized protein LOC128392119 n=1 Tax=Panonychus citri TaxID=50023 RepID=UPI0023078D98|nr:uncharacterized protein LOC128392119 [Panonychus citri]
MSKIPRQYIPYSQEQMNSWPGLNLVSSAEQQQEPERDPNLNKKLLDEKVSQSAQAMAPPKDYHDEILKAMAEVKKSGLNVCAMDMELARIRMKDGSPVSVPVWISIVDGSCKLVYHEFIRHPDSSIIEYDYGTECHGLKPKDVEHAKDFHCAKEEVEKLFKQYDRIIVSGQINDFASLFISIEDHLKLLPKIVCVSSYYNCRKSSDGLGIKFCAFLMLNVILQDETHSPLVDAAYTLYLYLIDFENQRTISKFTKTKRLGKKYHGYVYPKNEHMSSLLRETMDLINDWPQSFKYNAYDSEASRYYKMNSQKFKAEDYVTASAKNSVPRPYIFDELRKKTLTSQNLRQPPPPPVEPTYDVGWDQCTW